MKKPVDSDSEVSKIRAKLGHLTMQWTPAAWLDTGFPDVNEVMGNRDKGIPYGRIIELHGLPSGGKSAIALMLAALSQRQDNGVVIMGDFETSFDPEWSTKRGLDPSKVLLFQPYVGMFGKEKEARLISAPELCTEIEACIRSQSAHKRKSVVILDSLTSMLPEGEALAGLEDHNLRVKMELPLFLGSLLRRWVGLAQSCSSLVILVNQLRQNPMQKWGSKWYTPGGSAPLFYSHIRVKVRRARKGQILDAKKKVVGIRGILRCVKNKVGGTEGAEIGYSMMYNGPMQFMPVKDIEPKEKKEAGDDDE